MIVAPITADSEWSYTLHMSGMATTLPTDPEDDTVDRLRAVVEEVTGKPLPPPEPRRIGFY